MVEDESGFAVEACLRRACRKETRIRAILVTETGFQSTVIRNLSRTGAGLARASRVQPGDSIALELLDGRVLMARVAWWLTGACGVEFDKALGESDRLLAGPCECGRRQNMCCHRK